MELSWRWRFLEVFCLTAICCCSAAAGSLRTVWVVDLHNFLGRGGLGGGGGLPVFAVEFSPDGQSVAVIAGQFRTDADHITSRLVVLSAKKPEVDPIQFEVPSGNYRPTWSDSSISIDAGGRVIRLRERATCEVPELGLFLDGQIITWPTGPVVGLPRRFALFDRNCRRVGEFSPGEEWLVNDVSIDRHLMVVERPTGGVPRFSAEAPRPRETLIVSSSDRHVVSRWSGNGAPYGRFADRGTALCNSFGEEDTPTSSMRCWNVDDGRVISDAPGAYGGSPFATASRASRLVYSQYTNRPGLVGDWDARSFEKTVIWDFGTTKTVASWRPSVQAYDLLFARGRSKPVRELARFAISPDGQYIAEGGDGAVRLYRIEP